jgi:hypothetical protein
MSFELLDVTGPDLLFPEEASGDAGRHDPITRAVEGFPRSTSTRKS